MSKRILIVEDNEDNRRILVYRLQKLGGFELVEARNGREALDRIAEAIPDLIFLDLKMPIMNGWETAAHIRAMDGPASKIPIVAITAQAMEGDEEVARSSGCDDYLSKPILDTKLVLQKLERFFGPSDEWQAEGGAA